MLAGVEASVGVGIIGAGTIGVGIDGTAGVLAGAGVEASVGAGITGAGAAGTLGVLLGFTGTTSMLEIDLVTGQHLVIQGEGVLHCTVEVQTVILQEEVVLQTQDVLQPPQGLLILTEDIIVHHAELVLQVIIPALDTVQLDAIQLLELTMVRLLE
eukprot:TRINITY_DN3453_c0_g1_i3.p5 TRINITY_DN3453_c0_g1~~TRINITY_DN3453_c0_g1_i3.p5  ORF type:complete len:156 (+),score=28.82 TRINITY_DN3453_c0_g1_i3:100-567(+)